MLRKEVADSTGVDIETLRYYERLKLISPPKRRLNGYREYGKESLNEIRFIQHCRSLGVSINEIKILKSIAANPHSSCHDVNVIIDHNLKLIEQKIRELKNLRHQLRDLAQSCGHDDSSENCNIIKSLKRAAKGQDCVCHKKKK